MRTIEGKMSLAELTNCMFNAAARLGRTSRIGSGRKKN